jgi:hypothetical protein
MNHPQKKNLPPNMNLPQKKNLPPNMSQNTKNPEKNIGPQNPSHLHTSHSPVGPPWTIFFQTPCIW